MPKKINQFMLLLMVVTVMMSSAIGTTTVYADDGTTGESSEPAGAEVAPGDEATPPEPSGDENVVVDEGQAPPEENIVPATEQPVVEEPVLEEPASVAEILEQAPEGTELVVLNAAGEVEPLATEAAAEIIATNDPMWCPELATPGDSGCTASQLTFASLITVLAGGGYSGNGIIWVADGYNGDDNSQIEFNGADLSTLRNSNLTIQGGWSGGNNTTINPNATSNLDVSMVFVNWAGNITLNDLDIAAADGAGFGLFTNTTGNVALNNVSVNNTTLNASGKGDGAILNTTGNVNIANSEFDSNKGTGLQVQSTGTIGLNTVSASSNTITGAYLDNCRYETVATGLCAGTGAVTITSATANLFNGNGFNGLFVDAGGGIAMDHAWVNNNALNGAILQSLDDNGTGNVTIDQSEFSTNKNATGLDILTDGSIGLTNVDVYSNGTGAFLDTTNGVGAINVTNSNFGIDDATGNTWTGLHAESGGLIDLTNVVASDNGTNGAYLEAQGNIDVTDGTFNNNVESNYPQDPGLYAKSHGGNITLTNVTADGNVYGAGAVLSTSGTGAISVTGDAGHFNGNGTFGIQVQSGDGNITLDGVTASLNKVKGAYLSTYGLGNIFIINDSDFVENGSYGIYASTSKGNIELDQVTVTGDNKVDDGAVGEDNLTDYGAVLSTSGGGNVLVSDSAFNLNTGVGLIIASSGKVDLVDVTADQNGGNGVEVYSSYTASCRCPESKVVNVAVSVDGGTFTNNSQYGLMVKPGPEGTLVFVNPSIFGGNGLGEYLLDLSDPEECEKCGCDEPSTEPRKPNVVQVPFDNGAPVEQACDEFSSTVLELPNGTWANVGCPYTGFSNLSGLNQENIPGALGPGANYLSGVILSLTDGEGNSILNEDGTVTINFKIREDSRSRKYSVLFWDPTLNDGKGGWVQLPQFEAGTSFPLHPDDPEDGRVITSGVKQIGDTISFTVNFPGIFVLTAR